MEKRKKTSAVVITVLIVCTGIVFTLILLPHFSPNSNKGPCSSVESDAATIVAAIADYFAVPSRTQIKSGDLSEGISIKNPWTLVQCDGAIYIYVYDLNELCPIEYQDVNAEWNAGIYTEIMKW